MLFPENPVVFPLDVSDDLHPEVFPKVTVCFQAGTAVVIAGGYYYLHGRTGFVDGKHGIGIHALGTGRGRRVMIDVTADEQRVRLVGTYGLGKLFQESLLLGGTVEIIETMA